VHVPGWHEATKELQQQGKLQMVGIIQEQHPDRARLFMQWKQMDWPILVDSLNLLDVRAVPITLVIDEHGIIRKTRIPLKEAAEFAREFVNQTYESPGESASPAAPPADLEQLRAATASGSAKAWKHFADALFLWAPPGRISEAVEAYQRAVKLEPQDERARFRLGVAYRKRYDSDWRRAADFQSAVEHWKQALDLNPNQYIWRRRIQQYGPRLEKPYPFYDWVHEARKSILARGDTPASLTVEPAGAEFARPLKRFEPARTAREEPDPKGRIHRDNGKFIRVETTAVPPSIEPGASARFHVVLRPNQQNKAHWNNEVEDLVVWLNPPDAWTLNEPYLTSANPPQPVSQEVRRVEFEAKSPEAAAAASVTIPGYALYYVCEDVNGTCLYRRQDISLQVEVR
jgi:tetratricopeptide (TPR) repeat protein